MALAGRQKQERADWSELLPILATPADSLEQSFLEAVTAIASARREGHLTDEEADILMRYTCAVMVEAKFNMIVGPVIERSLRIPGIHNRQWPGLFTPFSSR